MEQLLNRVNRIINTCWTTFSNQVGNGGLRINKEASMQLQFAYLLKTNLDNAIENKDEFIHLELETGIPVNGRLREVDIVIEIKKGATINYLPIELKCYRTGSSSGGSRGAQDIFRLGIYEDMQLLESYANTPNYLQGIQLTMTDIPLFAFPKKTTAKSWGFNTSNGYTITNGLILNIPMGRIKGIVNITLTKNYQFNWETLNGFYFLMLRGS